AGTRRPAEGRTGPGPRRFDRGHPPRTGPRPCILLSLSRLPGAGRLRPGEGRSGAGAAARPQPGAEVKRAGSEAGARTVTAVDALRFEADIDAALASGDHHRAERLAQQYCSAADGPGRHNDPARAPWFRAGYLAAQVALALGWLGPALERLRPLLAVIGALPE